MTDPIVLRADRWVDVEAGKVRTPAVVVVDGNRIAAVNPAETPSPAIEIDLGDVTLQGAHGRLLSMAIMIVGISLFLRLAQAVFRPGGKVRHPCPRCGLQRHDADAVHCKACGLLLNIPNDED